MSRRGAITVECDRPGCHAEAVFTAAEVRREPVDGRLRRDGWQCQPYYTDGDLCPQCVEEARDAADAARDRASA